MTIQKALFAVNEMAQNLAYDLKDYLEEIIRVTLDYVKSPNFSTEVKYWAMQAL
jgi:hypothetical protein